MGQLTIGIGSSRGKGGGAGCVSATYTDLVALRDNGKLQAGTEYRITDYVTTTSQTDTQSAGHPFDVIVTADSPTTLNEVARCCLHEGDTYFQGCDLQAWQIKYCLDNDTQRFAWADTTNGKGVIYRMIDEFNNDIPYDFKNIQFKSGNTYVLTFSGDRHTCYGNKMGAYCEPKTIDGQSCNVQRLNGNIFEGNYCHNNTLGNNCYSNTFRTNCYYNTLGDECYSNTLSSSSYNTLGNKCYSNTFSSSSYNTLGNECYSKYRINSTI